METCRKWLQYRALQIERRDWKSPVDEQYKYPRPQICNNDAALLASLIETRKERLQ